MTDILIILIPLKSPGLANVGDARVHTGFLAAYNLVARTVLNLVGTQLEAFPDYSVVVTGKSPSFKVRQQC